MKRILLVDDDFLALNAFYSLTDWARLGLRIVREAHSGREALSYLKSCAQLPDAAFIDVCMPDTDGIALLQALRAQYPSIVCFMLSSHSDYPYVRETLKLGAADYLLKHELSAESLMEALTQHGLVLLDQPLTDTPDQQLSRLLAGEEETQLSGHLICARYAGTRPLLDAQRSSILQTCRHILNDLPGAAVCSPADTTLTVVLPAAGHETTKESAQAQQRAALLEKALIKYHNVRYAFSAPCFCPDSVQLLAAYRLYSLQGEPHAPSRAILDTRERAVLSLAVANGAKPLLEQTLRTLFESNADSLPELHNALLVLLAHTRQSLSLPDLSSAAIPRDAGLSWFVRQFSDLCDHSGARLHTDCSPAIRNALYYIGRHYAEDIQLRDVAQYCHVSYTHLSYLFKKETGESLIRTLTRVRVYHAAYALLLGNASVSSACRDAGFNGYNHFVSTFKAVTGMTPSEFRKSPTAVTWLLHFNASTLAPHSADE